jgi:hypothetical protein
MRVTAIQIAAIARPVHAATQLRFSAGDATGRSARSDVGERNGPHITMGVPKSAGCLTQELMSLWLVPFHRADDLRPDILAAVRDGESRGTVRHWVADLEAEARNAAMRYFHRKWTNTRPELCGSFSTRW